MVSLHSDSTPGDLIGQELGPYRIVRRLGVGGMAQTFEAVRRGPGDFSQRVCLKVVLPFFQSEPAFGELFKHEARLAAKLRHTNIVGVIDFGEIDGMLYMALQLVDGIDLEALLRSRDRKRLPHEHVALIGRELARALEHAHNPPRSRGEDEPITAIIHRDISPSNVLISRLGEILLTDFGVAKAVTNKWGKQSNVKGKIPYMSPEQLMGEPVDARSDLFSLGVVLFEALSGQHPFERGNEPATIMASLSGEHLPLSELAPDAPHVLCEVIEKLLEPDPSRRPQSASALIELLDALGSPPLTHRELGQLVAEAVPSPDKEQTSGVGLTGPRAEGAELDIAEAPTTPGVSPPPPLESAGAPGRPRRQGLDKVAVVAALVVAALAAATFALLPEEETGRAPQQIAQPGTEEMSEGDAGAENAPQTPAAAPSQASAGQVEATTAPADAAQGGASGEERTQRPGSLKSDVAKATAPRPARLTVVVFPFGQIWINGKRQGTAPLKDHAMKPGVYQIGAGQGSPSKTRKVRLHPGQREKIVFDLTAPEP